MVRRFALSVLLVFVAPCLCGGCWDRVALEDIAWVQALGFDAGADGSLRVTAEIGVPQGPERATGGRAAERRSYVTMTIDARTGLEAFDLVSTIIGRRTSLMHTQLYVFGEEFARSDLRSLLQTMERFREVRGAALVAVARGCRAEDILRVTTSPLELSPSRYLETMLQQHARTGLFENTRFKTFVMGLEAATGSTTCPLIGLASGFGRLPSGGTQEGGGFPPTPRVGERIPEQPKRGGPEEGMAPPEAGQVPYIGGGPVAILGSAVFQGGKMVGDLDGEEARAMLMIKGDFERGALSVPDPERPEEPQYMLSVDLREGSSRITTRRYGNRVEIDVNVDLEVDYVATKTQTDYSDPRNAPIAERAIAEYVKNSMERAISHAKELGVDVFGFGQKLRRTFLTWPEYEEFSWPASFPEAEVTVNVDVHIRRFGMILAPPRIPRDEVAR